LIALSNDSQEYERRLYLETQQFVLDRKTTDVRLELYQHMITYSIFDHAQSDGTLDHKNLLEFIGKDYHIKKIPELHIQEAIETLMEKKEIEIVNQRLSLSQIKRNEIKKSLKNTENREVKIKTNLSNSLKKRIPDITEQQVSLILNNFSLLLGTTFAKFGSISARILTQGTNRIGELKKRPGFQEIYQKKILNVVKQQHHKELDKLFNEFFKLFLISFLFI